MKKVPDTFLRNGKKVSVTFLRNGALDANMNSLGPGPVNVDGALRILISVLLFVTVSAYAATEKIVYGVPNRISSLNPYLITGIDSFTVLGFTIEPLARYEPFSQEFIPWLAEDIDTTSKSIRVTLKKDIKFHNGEPLTAEDVKFTWESYNDPKYKGEVWRAMWSDVESVVAQTPIVAVFRFKKRMTFQNYKNVLTALRILPKSYYGKLNHEEWGTKLIGTGPFIPERFERGQALHLKANSNWWGWKELRLAQSPGVIVKPVPDAKLAEQMLAKKDLDIYEVPSGVPPPQQTQYLKSPFGRGFSLAPNFRNKILQDPKIRRALIELWNRQALAEKVFNQRLTPAIDSFSASTPYYPKGKPIEYDPKKAAATIKQKGFTAEKPLTLKVLAGQTGTERWLGLYQNDAAQVGVKIEIETISDENQWWQLLQHGKYDLVAYDGAFSETPHPAVWHSKGAYNSSGIHDPKLDQMLDQLDFELDTKKRHGLQTKVITYLRKIHAEIPGLATDKTAFLLSPELTVDQSRPLEPWHWRKKVQH